MSIALAAAPAAAADAAAVLRHGASVSARNALIVEVRVALSGAARVYVEYDHPQAGRYRTPLSGRGAAHVIPLVRLRPETTYDYTIFVVDGSAADGSAMDGAAAQGAAGPGGRFTTGPLPRRLAAISMQARGRSSQPLILSGYLRGDGRAYLLFRDETGAPVWYYDASGASAVRALQVGAIAQLPGGALLFTDPRRGLIEITPLGEMVDRLERGGAAGIPHHEVLALADGRVIYLSRESVVFEEVEFRVDDLRVWDRARGRVEQVWDAGDFWDIRDLTRRAAQLGTVRWTHLNSVSIGPRGNLIISSRVRNQVISLSADLRAIEWQLHGPDSDYRFPNPNDRFYGPHTAAQLDDGNVLLFDNGWGRPDAEGGAYSRALELRLDEAAGTAVKVWEYRPTPDIYSPAMSSAYRLSNGNTLINFGVRATTRVSDSLPLTVVEVDAAGNEVFRVDTRQRYVPRPNFPRRYRAYGGIGSIMGETMLRPPAAAPEPFDDDHYLAQELAEFRALQASLAGRRRAAGGVFDLYLAGDRLVYAKEPCGRADVRERFFLHVFPAADGDSASGSRERGFDTLDFEFWWQGVLWEGVCLAAVTLPDYAIARLRTGQLVRDTGRELWAAELEAPAAEPGREAGGEPRGARPARARAAPRLTPW